MTWRERAVPVPGAGGLVLEGVWQAGRYRAAVIAPPHPEYGGSLENPVVNEIAYALYQEGYASLRFNWRGVGGSQGGVSDDWGAARDDYEAALTHVEQTIDAPVLGAGYSFGAVVALHVGLSDRRVRALLLVSPPVGMIRGLPLGELAKPLHAIVGANDNFAPADALSELLAPLPNARLDVIPGADHFFSRTGLAELSQTTRSAGAAAIRPILTDPRD